MWERILIIHLCLQSMYIKQGRKNQFKNKGSQLQSDQNEALGNSFPRPILPFPTLKIRGCNVKIHHLLGHF